MLLQCIPLARDLYKSVKNMLIMSYYTLRPGRLKEFFEKIQDIARPPTASNKWLATIGFESKSYYQYLQILEQIKFVDASRKPTERWKEFQDVRTAESAMARGLREGYDILWKTYKEPYNESAENLTKVFQVELNVNEKTARRAYRTFTILSDFADFDALKEEKTKAPIPALTTQPSTVQPQPTFTITPEQASAIFSQKRELGVNINIQVTLPETTDADVYDKIFGALKKHFFPE